MISTCNTGNFPKNSLSFWNKLSIKFPENILKKLRFSVFGFGDKTYPNFNTSAKVIFYRLKSLGA